MASAIRKLTGVGGDVRKIARLLQKKAPPGHMLAYINQEEADLLKARGGSGKPHADTGVPSFAYDEPEFYTEQTAAAPQTEPVSEPVSEVSTPQYPGQYGVSPDVQSQTAFSPSVTADVQSSNVAPFVSASNYYRPPFAAAAAPVSAEGAIPFRDPLATPRETGARETDFASVLAPGGSEAPTTKIEKGTADEIANWWKGLSKDTKARLGIGGVQSILGAYQVSQAMEQARKGREDLANVAKPYQEEGKKLIAQAQSGQLTPAAQQQLQAAQAQAAQGAQARGGVGAQQAQMAVEGIRQQLLQNQYDYGLKISGIGDSIATGAIKSGMEADRYVNQLASNYASNVARTLSGTPTYVNPFAPTNT